MASSKCVPTISHPSSKTAFTPQEQPQTLHPILRETASLLQQCSAISEMKQLHAKLIKTGFVNTFFAQNRLTAFCTQSPSTSIDYALLIFSHSPIPTEFMRNRIIRFFAESKAPEKAVLFYCDTHQSGLLANNYTFPALLKACSRYWGLEEGKQVHNHVLKNGLESDIHVCNALIHLYSSCGCLDLARQVFDRMSQRDIVTWNSMLHSYSQNGLSGEALTLFRDMQVLGLDPDGVTMISILSACAHAGALELGKWVHAYIDKNRLDFGKINVRTALIDMYSKCGCIERAIEVFEDIPTGNIVCWTAMINGLAINGLGSKALELFDQMLGSNVEPDEISLISVLSACSHAGLIEQGRRIFGDLETRYRIHPQMEHYGCMVDLLGRAGHVDEAHELIKKMPFAPNAVMWRTLLGACWVHKKLELGEIVMQEILKLEPRHHGDYVLLSNIYEAAGRIEDAANVRMMMKKKRITKIPGSSFIEVDNQVHSFIVEDKSHQHSDEIYKMLDEMGRKLKLAGYAPDTSRKLIDLEEEGEEKAHSHHSEKVAIAYGLISTSHGDPLRVVKNLRVCNRCHCEIKLISKIYKRKIILRDRNRFHHFRGGTCSCGDYWYLIWCGMYSCSSAPVICG